MSERPEKHGVFYPRGYVIVTFDSGASAEQVRRLLVEGGYDEGDVHLLDTEQVMRGTSEDLRQLSPLIKALGVRTLGPGHPATDECGRAGRLQRSTQVRSLHDHQAVTSGGALSL